MKSEEVSRIFAFLSDTMTLPALTMRDAGRRKFLASSECQELWFTFPAGYPRRREGIMSSVPIGCEQGVELSFLCGIFLVCLGIFLDSGSLF